MQKLKVCHHNALDLLQKEHTIKQKLLEYGREISYKYFMSGMAKLASVCGVVDLFSIRIGDDTQPATYQRGQAETILQGTYNTTTLEEPTALFIQHLQQKSLKTLEGSITSKEIIGKLKNWPERSTTCSPSGLINCQVWTVISVSIHRSNFPVKSRRARSLGVRPPCCVWFGLPLY